VSVAVLGLVYGSTFLYHVKYFQVTYWDVRAYWPLFSWDLYSVPPPTSCYSITLPTPPAISNSPQDVSAVNSLQQSTFVTACRVQVGLRVNISQESSSSRSSRSSRSSHPSGSEDSPPSAGKEEWLQPSWAYDLRSVAFSHLVLQVQPKDLFRVATFFGLVNSSQLETARLGPRVGRLDLLDHVIGTALKLSHPEQMRGVESARLVRRVLALRCGKVQIVDKVLRRCPQKIVDEARIAILS